MSSKPKVANTKTRVAAVDLFCGAGGKTHGFIRAGIEVVAGIDIDPTCRYPYEHNNKPAQFINKSINDVSATDVSNLFPPNSTKILIGCAPCQPFSTYSYRYGSADGKRRSRDKRWGLLHAFRSLVHDVQPDIVAAENVPELAKLKHGVYANFIADLNSFGYQVTERIVKCADYGIPQTRERLVVLASRMGKIDLLPATHSASTYVTVRQAIGHMPHIQAGEVSVTDALHRACKLSPLNFRRMLATPEGGGWQDWPRKLRAECHKRTTGQTYPSVYGRMRWDDLAPTLTTQCYGFGNGRFGHPQDNRAISLREAALLQTFPPDYKFAEDDQITFKHTGKHIGNAVPVRLGEVIAHSIMAHLRLASSDSEQQ